MSVADAGYASEPPTLAFPLFCELGQNCFIQQYLDHDPGPEARDYACGNATYDGHRGTDIRLVDTGAVEAGFAVLAAADGNVRSVRDGMADRLVRNPDDRAAVADRECGNGVLLDHGGGWVTQYCHLRQGSIVVRPGQAIASGGKLGEVGYSGDAAFPHLHLAVQQRDVDIDPFTGTPASAVCGATGQPLWAPSAAQILNYRPTQLVGTGIAAGPVQLQDLETGALGPSIPRGDWPAMVVWGWVINLREGDLVEARLKGPSGEIAHNRSVAERNRAQSVLFAGHRRLGAAWPAGPYRRSFSVTRAGKLVIDSEEIFEIDP